MAVAIVAPVVAAVVAPIPVPCRRSPSGSARSRRRCCWDSGTDAVAGTDIGAAGRTGPDGRRRSSWTGRASSALVSPARWLGCAGPARSFARLLHIVAVPARHAVGTLPPGEAGLVVRLNLLLLPGLDLLLLANLELRPLARSGRWVLDLLARLLALLAGLLAIGLLFRDDWPRSPAVAPGPAKRGRSAPRWRGGWR